MTDVADLLPIANKAVDIASELLRTQEPGKITTKADRDLVSDLDYAIESAVRDFLLQETPEIGFLGEEEGTGNAAETGLIWVLDPIDGTSNFINSLPLHAVSLGLVQRDKPVLGVVHTPHFGTRYTAVEDQGAYAGNQPIHVSNTAVLTDAIVALGDYAVGAGSKEKNPPRVEIAKRLASDAHRVRMLGSAAIDLAWVADGRLDASVMLSNKPWDTAAGVIIVREAGGVVVDHDGTVHSMASRATIAVTPGLLDPMMAILRGQFLPT